MILIPNLENLGNVSRESEDRKTFELYVGFSLKGFDFIEGLKILQRGYLKCILVYGWSGMLICLRLLS